MKLSPYLLLICLALSVGFFACESGNGSGSGGSGSPSTPPTPTDQFVPAPGQTGVIQFSHFEMQFGPVTAGEKVTAVYPFINASQQTVTIEKVGLSCHCLSAEFPTERMVPGEVGEIRVTFDTEGQAKEVQATHEKLFPVFIKGEQLPIETLKLRGVVQPAPPKPEAEG